MHNHSVSFAPGVPGSATVDVPPPVFLMNELSRIMVIRAIFWATKYGIAEKVKDGPKSVAELAQATESHPIALYRVLRALASIGIFQEEQAQGITDLTQVRFAQSPTSSFLLPDTPGSMYAMVMMWQSRFQWESWGNIEYSVKTNKPALEAQHNVNIFDFLSQNPAEYNIFNRAMTSMSLAINQPIASAYATEFSGIQTLVDVGGGHGSFLETVLQAHPQMQGILFDRPEVVEEVTRTEPIARNPRVQLARGDFFASVPAGGDAYFLKQVVMDWSDEECVRILRNCRNAMRPGGRVLVAEQVLHPGVGSDTFGKFLDLQMLVVLHGGNRTEQQYRNLFSKAGLTVTRIIPTHSVYSIVEGVGA